MAFPSEKGFVLIKNVGKLEGEEFENTENLKANICLGHTRWATHGSVTKINAHPHVSNNNKIAVVHNGIIENFQEIK